MKRLVLWCVDWLIAALDRSIDREKARAELAERWCMDDTRKPDRP